VFENVEHRENYYQFDMVVLKLASRALHEAGVAGAGERFKASEDGFFVTRLEYDYRSCQTGHPGGMMEPHDLPTREPDDGVASATQLSILLASATSAIDEEFRRAERLDAKSRNQTTITGTFFAVVQAVVIGLLNGLLGGDGTRDASAFVPWLAVAGGVAAIATLVAVLVSYDSWKLRDDPTLSVKTIRDYIDAAREGNPAVGVKLVSAYADIAEGRRKNNAKRAKALDGAAKACGVALLFIGVELVLAFVAVAVQ
jgi:hypothetical protein